MSTMWNRYAPTIVTLLALVVTGSAVTAYILIHQRFPNPLEDTYEVEAVLPSADGVAPGSGQPVKVSGVPVGVISGLRLEGGRAVVTLDIRRADLPAVHRDAMAVLRPISPLKDLQVVLDPGSTRAPALPDGGRIPISRTASPVDLDEFLAALDTDTRTFLSTLINGSGAGLAGRGPDLRLALKAFAPTAKQVDDIASTLAKRRRSIRRLVSNLGVVARAAADDARLAELVSAGNATLEAVAREEQPLRASVAELPRTLREVGAVLPSVTRLARELSPTLDRLQPVTGPLPGALRASGTFSRRAARGLASDLRPFVREATPVVADLADGVGGLRAAAPDFDAIVRVLTYLTNELTYNPPGDNEGNLFWTAWAGHNIVSTVSTADANGAMVRATVFMSCALAQGVPGIGQLLADALAVTPSCKSGSTVAGGR